MASFQFAHISWAANSRLKKPKTSDVTGLKSYGSGWSASDLTKEAMRIKGHHPHVEAPKSPTILHGVDAMEAAKQANEWAAKQKDRAGRRLGKNAPCLAAGVICCHQDRIDDWPKLRDAALAYLIEQHGDRLISVIEHLDEAHPHFHFYLVAHADEKFGAVHPGYKARNESRQVIESVDLQRDSYRKAMKGWQDDLYANVYSQLGFDRIGPARQRLNRNVYLLKKREEDVKRKEAEIEKLSEKVNAEEAASRKRALELNALLAKLKLTPAFQMGEQISDLQKSLGEKTALVDSQAKKIMELQTDLSASNSRVEEMEALIAPSASRKLR